VALVDVVVVSYNSEQTLRSCVRPLANERDLAVVVVDNDSDDSSVESVRDLNVTVVSTGRNAGFAAGSNRGAEEGTAPYLLFLNPDARIDPETIRHLAGRFEEDPAIALVAPRLLDDKGLLEFSLRRFPRLRSTYAQALFVHRLFPRAKWTDECIRDPLAYTHSGDAEWVSGACMLVRRRAFEEIGGWDEDFFLYGEDIDLCHRLHAAGYRIAFDADSQAIHAGGASAPRARMLPVLARGRILFVRKHKPRLIAYLHQFGIALGAGTHALLTTQGREARIGQVHAFRASLFYTSSLSH